MIFNVGAGGASNADSIKYDNSKSGLEATNVQGAVDELNESLGGLNFAQDEEGNWGYIPSGADTVIPFSGNINCETIASGSGTSFTKTVVAQHDGYAYATVTANSTSAGALKITLSNNTKGIGGNQKSASGKQGHTVYGEVLPVSNGDELKIIGESLYSSTYELFFIHN